MTAPAAAEAEFRAELERVAELAAIARELRPGGAGANGYRESVVWADVALPGDSAANG